MDNAAPANAFRADSRPVRAAASVHGAYYSTAETNCCNRPMQGCNHQRTEKVIGVNQHAYGTLDTMNQTEILDAQAACQMLCVGRTTLYKLVAAGEINSFTVGRRRLFTRAGLTHFIEKRGGLVDRPESLEPPNPPISSTQAA